MGAFAHEEDVPVFPFDIPPSVDVVPEFERLRDEAPVTRVRLSTGGDAYLVTRYDDVRRVYADPLFSRARLVEPEQPVLLPGNKLPHVLINTDAPEHTRLRKLVTRAFTARAVERLRPRVEEITDELLDGLLEVGPPADAVADFALPLPASLIAELMGIPRADVTRLQHWLEHILSISAHTAEATQAALGELTGYLGQLIATKRENPADDLTSALIQVRDGGDQLSEAELMFMLHLLLAGGFETTATLIPNALMTLFRQRDQWERLCEDPNLVPLAVEELLRYVPITRSGLERVATEDVQLSGVTVPAGSTVLPLVNAAHFDPTFVSDPQRLDVARPPSPHLGFGHGIHHCVGASLGRMELTTAVSALVTRMPNLHLAVPENDLEWKAGLITRGPLRLPIAW
jgi:cytochrome P450